jgi:hypothetical protein
MESEIDRGRPPADGLRRRLIIGLGTVALGIVTLGPDGLCRVLKNFTTFDDNSNEFDRRDHPDEFDEGGERTLHEIIYYDRRLESYWPVGFYPSSPAVAAIPLAQAARVLK